MFHLRSADRALGVSPIRVSEVIRGNSAIRADTALCLAAFFGTSPQMWMTLQGNGELALAATMEPGRDIVPLASSKLEALH